MSGLCPRLPAQTFWNETLGIAIVECLLFMNPLAHKWDYTNGTYGGPPYGYSLVSGLQTDQPLDQSWDFEPTWTMERGKKLETELNMWPMI